MFLYNVVLFSFVNHPCHILFHNHSTDPLLNKLVANMVRTRYQETIPDTPTLKPRRATSKKVAVKQTKLAKQAKSAEGTIEESGIEVLKE